MLKQGKTEEEEDGGENRQDLLPTKAVRAGAARLSGLASHITSPSSLKLKAE